MGNTSVSDLRLLPSIDRLLSAQDIKALITQYGRAEVKRITRNELESMRVGIRQGDNVDTSIVAICNSIHARLKSQSRQSLRRVYNLTGTLLHTNLGRATLPQCSIDAVTEIMAGASNLEYDLDSGRRGERDSHVCRLICGLSGAEAATIVNNNAAAVMLVLNTLALGKEVAVSRGELVEIGGSFRIPDIMARSGCTLVEVGTTNRTHLHDFESALNAQTAMVMKVHQSNYVIEGFTASVEEARLAEICAKSNLAFVVDLGSGTLVDLESYGLAQEPTPMQALKNGADLVTFSGDKLLGGPQAGIIAGRHDLIRQLNANPMKRALRCDKMTIAALSSVLQLYQHSDDLPEHLPVLKSILRNCDDIRQMALPLVDILSNHLKGKATVSLIDCDSETGSGTLPDKVIASVGIAMRPAPHCSDYDVLLDRLASAFRRLPVPVIGRIHRGSFVLDCRCLDNPQAFAAQLSELEIIE
ncbi:MAG: L-seryl-tRNA(Sec) selenium transferase [Gammaproteobacteria bacterium]|nr:L-seryl-tRNA(Sec) selenium transferase [Gammaproteobacteria bacterium]